MPVHKPRPVCGMCHRFMDRVRIGVLVQYGEHLEAFGDLFECASCVTSVITDFGMPLEGDGSHRANSIKVVNG